MVSESTQFLINFESIWVIFRLGVVVLVGLYFIFSLIVVRQVNLMTETLITDINPIWRAISIIHAGLSLGLLVLLIGFYF